MIRELKIWKIKWIDAVGLKSNEILNIVKDYKFHELDIEACLEWNQKARIDEYEDYSFIIFHFPKYNVRRKIYELNSFNIFIWKWFLITFRDFSWMNIDNIFSRYSEIWAWWKSWENIKVTTGYILYEITQAMLEKMFKVSNTINREIKVIESNVFDSWNSSLVRDIMIKKRNIILLRNMFKPQAYLFKHIEFVINKMYKWKMEVYFEDLEDKLSQIVSEITILQEYIESVEDTFKTMIDIKTNFVIKVLTIFSAFMLPLTLITSFYGMNIDFPLWTTPSFVYILFFWSIMIMFMIYLILKKTWRF